MSMAVPAVELEVRRRESVVRKFWGADVKTKFEGVALWASLFWDWRIRVWML